MLKKYITKFSSLFFCISNINLLLNLLSYKVVIENLRLFSNKKYDVLYHLTKFSN